MLETTNTSFFAAGRKYCFSASSKCCLIPLLISAYLLLLNIAKSSRITPITLFKVELRHTAICDRLLDSHLKPVSVGSIGEIYIGGSRITQGYLNRPELTREKFIVNPFVEIKNPDGEFLYKTGDLAKCLPDGNIEFIDRVDNQVKIRGFRLELGEIEAVLSQHPQVNQVATIALTEDSGNKRLVAYIVPKNGIDKEAQKEQVAQWQEVDNAIYSQSNEVCDRTLNLIGWNNSYDGKPIPEAEMRDWVKQTSAF